MAKRNGHIGPYQQFTEVCLACGENTYDTDLCIEEGQAEQILAERKVRHDQMAANRARIAAGGQSPCRNGHQGPYIEAYSMDICVACGGTKSI